MGHSDLPGFHLDLGAFGTETAMAVGRPLSRPEGLSAFGLGLGQSLSADVRAIDNRNMSEL